MSHEKHVFNSRYSLTGYFAYAQTNTFPSNGNVGIGTISPSEVLTIRDPNIAYDSGSGVVNLKFDSGSGGGGIGFEKESINTAGLRFYTQKGYGTTVEKMRISNSGDVGIGTTAPLSKLHINGLFSKNEYGVVNTALNVYSSNESAIGTGGAIALGGNSGNANPIYPFAFLVGAKESVQFNDYAGYFAIHTVSSGANGEVNSANYERLRVTSNGNVGIGTTTPSEKFSVNGKIRAKEIKVESANWPDYVFSDDYKLPTLQQTEQRIKEKGHLEGLPSAAEVKADGIDLGEMNAKLLQKIEELTLHLIQKDKEISKLNDKFSELETRINGLIK